MFLGIGQVIGPLYGAIITEKFGFQVCTDSISIICLVFAIVYYIMTDGKTALTQSKWANISIEQMTIPTAPMPGICTPLSNPS